MLSALLLAGLFAAERWRWIGRWSGRIPIWFAVSGNAAARELAVWWWRNLLARDDRAAARKLSFAPIDSRPSPLTLIGAAAASAAGDHVRAG